MYNVVVFFDNNYLHYSVYVSGVCAACTQVFERFRKTGVCNVCISKCKKFACFCV